MPIHSLPPDLNPAQQAQFEQLLKSLSETEARGQRFEREWSHLFDQNKALREENHELQQGYERLRLQKGGFGFKMLLLSGFGGFLTALLLCFVYPKLKPAAPQEAALQQFKRQHQMEFELALSQGRFQEVAVSLDKALQHPENQTIRTDIEMMRELVEAAAKACQ